MRLSRSASENVVASGRGCSCHEGLDISSKIWVFNTMKKKRRRELSPVETTNKRISSVAHEMREMSLIRGRVSPGTVSTGNCTRFMRQISLIQLATNKSVCLPTRLGT